MSLQQMLAEVPHLSAAEKRALLDVLERALRHERAEDPTSDPPQEYSLLELRGLGREIWHGIDAQNYVNQVRQEWEHRR